MNSPNEQSARDFSLAHALLRVGLGLNLFTHGLVRLPDLAAFAAHTRQTMAQSPLPVPLVVAAGYAIPFVEITTGALLLLGLFLRPALVLGFLLLLVLMVGICSRRTGPWPRSNSFTCSCSPRCSRLRGTIATQWTPGALVRLMAASLREAWVLGVAATRNGFLRAASIPRFAQRSGYHA